SGPDFASSRNPRRINVFTRCRPQRFCRLRTETAGTREKSKSLPHNKFTHVNAPAAFGIPAAPYLGMTCRSVNPVRKHRNKPQPLKPASGNNKPPALVPLLHTSAQHSPRFRAANRRHNRHRKAPPIAPRLGHESRAQRTANRVGIGERIGSAKRG